MHIPNQKNQKLFSQLKNLSKEFSYLITIWKINDARSEIAHSVFESMREAKLESDSLNQLLVDLLDKEMVTNLTHEAQFKGEIILDILKRNLFERTADIWFIGEDKQIKEFLENSLYADKIQKRLQMYAEIYSVYDDVFLCDEKGECVLSAFWEIKDNFSQELCMQDFQQVSWQEYGEYYGSVWYDGGKKLLYSRKVYNEDREYIGMVILSFSLQKEMEMIFNNLNFWKVWTILSLYHIDGTLIATNSPEIAPKNLKNQEFFSYNSKNYLSYTQWSTSYQWYQGFEWYANVMIPLEEWEEEQKGDMFDSNVLLQSQLIAWELKKLISSVYRLDGTNRLIILNGKIKIARQESREANALNPIFDQMVELSKRSSDLFHTSIKNILEILVKNLLEDIKSIANLWVNILDRNLYERSNDVRWWSLDGEIMKQFSISKSTVENQNQLEEILLSIHNLYTVYDVLYVTNAVWKIQAATQYDQEKKSARVCDEIVGKYQSDFQKIENVKNSLEYSVSLFQKNNFSHKYSYSYFWKIFDENQKMLWGFTTILNAQDQFQSILHDVLPNRDVENGDFALFVDRQGAVISSTKEKIQIWQVITVDKKFLILKNGESISSLYEYEGEKYIVGSSVSSWYREFKNDGKYRDDVVCLVFIKI